jgi:AraC-like DNA-binding protein
MGATHLPAAERSAGEVVDEHVRGLPAAPLRPLIASYAGYRQAGQAPAVHRGMPSPFLTVIFTLHEPLVVAGHPDPGQAPGRYDTLAGGLHTAPALITHHGSQSGVQLALSPLGARALLGIPAGELASIDLDAADVLGSVAGEIHDRLRSATGWPGRFAVLDELLLARISGGREGRWAAGSDESGAPGVSPEVGCAWRRLLASGGQASVAELAAETGWSERHLRSQFRHQIGLTPKAAARVVRFTRAHRSMRRLAGAGERPGLAELAVRCGYYDQAHLDREFRALAGCPPTQWLAEEFRNVQASADHGLTGSQP